MRIELKNLKWTMLAINKTLDTKELQQIGRKVEKFLLRNYSILCDIEIK